MEVYNNRFIETTPTKGANIGGSRGGVVILHDNTISGWGPKPNFVLACFRMFMGSWGGADGTNPWDINRPGGPFYSGTASVASSGASSGGTVTVSGNPNWTTNQWAGYSVKRTTNLGNKTDLGFSEIKSNTSNTLTYAPTGGFKPDLSFAAGDSLQLWKVDQALDQPGVSGGSLLAGKPATIPAGWNDQVVTPCYSWSNTREGGVHVNFGVTTKVVRLGTHYFNDTPMPGYTTFTYPHPLTTSPPQSPAPTRTSSLRRPWGKKQKKTKEGKRKPWEKRAKENPTNDMSED
jgi:hypothetical protein